MNNSISAKPRGALWPTEASRPRSGNAMTVAIVAALAIEGALIASVISMRVPAPMPVPAAPVMQMRLVEAVTPPPPLPPVVKKIVQRQSELPVPKPIAQPPAPAPEPEPKPKHVVRPTARPQRHVARRVVVPVPAARAPVAAQVAPPDPQAAPSVPGPAAPVAPGNTAAAPAAPASIAIVCPVQAKPEMPPRAIAEGITGAVTARATIKGGKVISVDIIKSTPPRIFDASVKRAMAQYQCKVDGSDQVVVEQSFDFTLN
jgi:protein TonB